MATHKIAHIKPLSQQLSQDLSNGHHLTMTYAMGQQEKEVGHGQ